jgi:hypothetical protein
MKLLAAMLAVAGLTSCAAPYEVQYTETSSSQYPEYTYTTTPYYTPMYAEPDVVYYYDNGRPYYFQGSQRIYVSSTTVNHGRNHRGHWHNHY